MGKYKKLNILEISPQRAKQDENKDLGVPVEQIWGSSDLVAVE